MGHQWVPPKDGAEEKRHAQFARIDVHASQLSGHTCTGVYVPLLACLAFAYI